MFILKVMWAAIKAGFLTALIGVFVFFILAFAQLIFGIPDVMVMTILFIVVASLFIWFTYDNYQASTFDKWFDLNLQMMKKEYKKEFGKEYIRDEKIPGIDYKVPKDEEFIVEDKWTGMPKYRIKNKANKDSATVEDYWIGRTVNRIRKK